MSERANELEYEGEEIYSERKEENKTNNNNKKHTENKYIYETIQSSIWTCNGMKYHTLSIRDIHENSIRIDEKKQNINRVVYANVCEFITNVFGGWKETETLQFQCLYQHNSSERTEPTPNKKKLRQQY